jgi:hypothetical protein
MRRAFWPGWLIVGMLVCLGCEAKQHVVPVKGKVLFNDQPLEFGGVMFQPDAGQPARATIQPDGTFVLTTFREGDGGTVGNNRVRVTCFPSQQPRAESAAAVGEVAAGASLIPTRYNDFSTSELTVEIGEQGDDEIVLRLKD